MRRSTLVAISAAATIAAAALIVLAVMLTGNSPTRRTAPPARPHSRPAVHPSRAKKSNPSAHVSKRTHARRRPSHRPSHARPQAKAKAKTQAKARPQRSSQTLPWRPDGTSLVAATRGPWLAVYRLPRANHPVVRLHNPDRIGTQRVLLVHSTNRDWVRVYLPLRPNGLTGWVRAQTVRLLRNPYRIVVQLRAHRLYVWREKQLFVSAKIVVGKATTPTPVGTYFIVDLLRPPDPNGAYGPYTYDLSAHSDVLKTFDGGDGHVAIHGTNAPWLLGQSASHGCIRVSNPVIRKLERVLPLGTPVLIRR